MKKFLIGIGFCLFSIANSMYAHDFSAENDDGATIYYTFVNGSAVISGIDKSYNGTLTIPPSVLYGGTVYFISTISEDAFNGRSGLTGITIHPSTKVIGKRAFANCNGLKNITIPATVQSVGERAFAYCESLETVSIYTTAKIGEGTFAGCSEMRQFIVQDGNESYSTIDDVLFNKDKTTLIAYPNARSSSYIIPTGVTTIAGAAFDHCDLTDIVISEEVTTIGNDAFYGCQLLTNITIPNSATAIGDYAFDTCSGLTNLVLGNGIITIGDYAFARCEALKVITLPNSLVTIGESSFIHCAGLISIVIPDNVTSIGHGAFWGCISAKDAIIGKSVVSIGNMSFYNCYNLKEIKSHNPIPPAVGDYLPFYNIDKNACKLYVPTGSLNAYKEAEGWKEFMNISEMDITGIPVLQAEYKVYASDGILYVDTPVAETVSVYSLVGQLLYSMKKVSGEIQIYIRDIEDKIMIVSGSSNWNVKLIITRL